MHFRVMTTDDLPGALELWRSCDGIGIGDSDSPAHLTAFLHRNPEMSWVALCDGRLIGAVLVGHDGRRGFSIISRPIRIFDDRGSRRR